ncbi:MAG: diguanylate cyclase [Gammaproteobacteria bacterium]|nr:diguanylate cyclase [Gammaproteobacteria bacterium]
MVNKPVLLIVDDVPANIQILASCLKDKYQIKVASDGFRCLELVASQSEPDLILLDIEMPGMNGYEVCRELKKNSLTKDIPVIFVTANDQEADEEKGLQLGAVDYITKPIRPSIVAARVNTHITLKQQRDQLLSMATHDQLTGLYNRHYLFHSAHKKIARSIRHDIPMSIAMLDIDHFKFINDQHGHPTGDVVLQSVAALLEKYSREEDCVVRFGGEEFIILFDHSARHDAQKKSEELRKLIEQLKPEGLLVTVSMGVIELNQESDSIEEMIKRADEALYLAKASGRNRVVVA